MKRCFQTTWLKTDILKTKMRKDKKRDPLLSARIYRILRRNEQLETFPKEHLSIHNVLG